MKKHFLVAFLALTTFISCKKDSEKDPNPSNPGSSKVLKRIIETENGVTTTHTLAYDGSKRLVSVRSSDNLDVTSLTYDGTGNVTKIENKEGSDRTVFEFTYNNGVPVSGTFKSFEKNEAQAEVLAAQYTLNYTVENGLVTKMKMVVPADPEAEEDGYELEYAISYSNGNVTKIESAGLVASSVAFTYGNKKPMLPATFKYVLDPSGFSVQFFAKNEVLTSTYDLPGSALDKTITNVYTYDNQGYVLTANDGDVQTKFEYE